MLGRDRIGIVLNEENAWASASELNELGCTWVRSIVKDFDRFQGRLAELPPGVGVIALLNSEAFLDSPAGVQVGSETTPGWEQRWSSLIDQFIARFGNGRHPARRLVVECLNEWDILGLSAEIAVRSVRIAGPKLRTAGLGCLLGSVASGDWPAQLAHAVQLLTPQDRELLDGACFHPYLKTVGGEGTPLLPAAWHAQQPLKAAVQSAYAIVNPPEASALKQLPMWLTEFGLNRRDVDGSVAVQSAYLVQAYVDLGNLPGETVAAACWFCWNDRTGICRSDTDCEQLGLWPAQAGQPAYATRAAYISCTFPPRQVTPVVEPVVVNGEVTADPIDESANEGASDAAAQADIDAAAAAAQAAQADTDDAAAAAQVEADAAAQAEVDAAAAAQSEADAAAQAQADADAAAAQAEAEADAAQAAADAETQPTTTATAQPVGGGVPSS
jgi:hypothetical protein